MPQLCGQALTCGFEGLSPPPELASALRRGERGGVIHFKRNLPSLEHAVQLNASIVALCPPHLPPMIGVDEEGGRVARLPAPALTLPPMRTVAERGGVELLREVGSVLGEELAHAGFSLDFAPILDVDTNPRNPIIGDRAFGRTPDDAAANALAFYAGLREHVQGCGKHFPGHGDTAQDSHLDLPVLDHDEARLRAIELPPFQRAIAESIDAIMTAHVVMKAFDADVPATLSRRVGTELLRGELGFRGVLISDDLEMKAVADRYAMTESAERAIEAGCDVLLVCRDVAAQGVVHEALIRRAERDGAFRARLAEAAERNLAMRRRRVPAPNAGALQRLLDGDRIARLRERLQSL